METGYACKPTRRGDKELLRLQKEQISQAADGSRTRVTSLGSSGNAVIRRPRTYLTMAKILLFVNVLIALYQKNYCYAITICMGVFFIILLISSIPAIVTLVWFRLARYPFSLPQFSISLLIGAASFFPALLLQNIFSSQNGAVYAVGKWGLFIEIFGRIAFTEEFSRLIVLVILFGAICRFSPVKTNTSAVVMASATGFIAGLGFAILESAVYGASNPGNALFRAFTAAPLHGACGFRVGSAIAMFREHPVQAFFRFLSAVIVHGVYNFMLIIPGHVPSIAAILIALAALASSVVAICIGMRTGE